ncbi:NADPH-dependent ferric siderophore reductase [Pantoea rodasii]|uniref:NADPH-dependent ferric siderophore reductase n=1 Tax=Pantoea rodasii TaxID=1076549 RepID=A0A2M9W961_9GAMM|nr:siderophore-interacting protein [Pantoea rodasii]ORM63949.1 NADPH-dependent ferric siderophore reductase [Pantoea rodasii]PJZ04062.1 NADPH-dependent ferric siderophore reductase [Pantoea rodasii]
MAIVPGYRLFNVTLLHKRWLTPSLMSCVFIGDQAGKMKIDGPDQRIKILFPSSNGLSLSLTDDGDWWGQLRGMPPEKRPISRTYTLRHVNAAESQMEVEFVIHGTEGPASAWVLSAMPGDPLQMVAPNREHKADSGGYEWKPAPEVERALIIADETALPAVKGILAQLDMMPSAPQVQVFQETPSEDDIVDLSHYTFAEIVWLPRNRMNAPYGTALLQAVKERVFIPEYATATCDNDDNETEHEDLWQSAAASNNRFYGWVAAESSAVKHIRRYLVGKRKVVPGLLSFMAYWCAGKG